MFTSCVDSLIESTQDLLLELNNFLMIQCVELRLFVQAFQVWFIAKKINERETESRVKPFGPFTWANKHHDRVTCDEKEKKWLWK